MPLPTNKNISDDIVPNISSALRDLQLGVIFVVFVGSHSKIYCSEFASPI